VGFDVCEPELRGGLRIADGVPGGLESRTLHYDGRNRLTSITASPQGNESYVYDPLDNVRQTVQAGTDRRFHYAPSTQRLEWIRTPTGQNLFGYQWNPRGEMTRRTHVTQGIPPINPPTIFRGGFESGLLESHTDFQFDRANRLTGSHNGQIAHLYDAHGRRVRTSQQFFGTRFEVYSQNGQLLYVEDGPTNTRHDYIQFNGQLVAERQQPLNGGSATTSYLHSDLLGSLSVKTANQGSVVYRSRYQAFGAPLDGWRDGPGYTKHVMDSASELVYMQQRYYDPATLRFISTDPVSADPLNFNRYWYANNNPYTFVDPDGREVRFSFQNGASPMDGAKTLAYLMGSRTAREEISQVHNSRETYTLSFDKAGTLSYDQETRTVTIDPTSGLRVGDAGDIQSPALGAAHEISHAAEHDRIGTTAFESALEAPVLNLEVAPSGAISVTYGVSPEEQRATAVEAKIAGELGEPARSDYTDDRGSVKTCGPTSRVEC
jgi:RHS repeat-associated protein